MDGAAVSKAKDVLKKLRSGAQFGNIQLKDVKEALADDDFLTAEGLLTANDNGVWEADMYTKTLHKYNIFMCCIDILSDEVVL